VNEDEKPVVVGKEEASGSGVEADPAGKLPCMDRLQEELSCAVRGIHLVVIRSVVVLLMMLENDLGIVSCTDLPRHLL
jgi:hypothetical protein